MNSSNLFIIGAVGLLAYAFLNQQTNNTVPVITGTQQPQQAIPQPITPNVPLNSNGGGGTLGCIDSVGLCGNDPALLKQYPLMDDPHIPYWYLGMI